jgi:hypothetical protein
VSIAIQSIPPQLASLPKTKLWYPEQVLFTPAAVAEPWGQQILAGSLTGPPVIRAFANLPQTLTNLAAYERSGELTSFEVSCYTDPLGIEHLTGRLAECIRYFGTRQDAYLRWVSKFDGVDDLLDLPHNSHTRCRFSVNASPVSLRFEGGTATVMARLQASSTICSWRRWLSGWSSYRADYAD